MATAVTRLAEKPGAVLGIGALFVPGRGVLTAEAVFEYALTWDAVWYGVLGTGT